MEFTVKIWWGDAEEDEIPMWIAESDDILGLTLENESLDKLVSTCKDVIPDLLIGNKQAASHKIETAKVKFLLNYSWEKVSAYG